VSERTEYWYSISHVEILRLVDLTVRAWRTAPGDTIHGVTP